MRLETQINQIYLTHPENKKTSLILYEEAINASMHLFVLAELKDLTRKSEAGDLKKISEIILESFRSNKKLGAELLFETALAQINQNLADLAHAGHKSWVGKFSCLITLKSSDNIYLANNGQVAAWLKRKSELLEVLPAEKRGIHPLKTFVNFTQGKLTEGDCLIITTANIFNFVSFELFGKILDQENAEDACNDISKILKDSLSSDQAFCAFMLEFSKKAAEQKIESPAEIYAPLPEEIESVESKSRFKLPGLKLPVFGFSLPAFSWPKFKMPKFKKFQWRFFQNLSLAGKFFFVSFAIFAVLLLVNLTVYGFNTRAKKTAQTIDSLIAQINQELNDAQSSLIYKNDNQALQLMGQAQNDFNTLSKLSSAKAALLAQKVEDTKNQINKVSFINDPKTYIDLKHHPVFLAKSPNGFLFGNQDSNSLSSYTTTLSDYFLLNSLKSPIVGITYFAPAGLVAATANELYHIDTTLKQLTPILDLSGHNIDDVKTINGTIYVHDKQSNQVIKVAYIKNKFSLNAVATGNPDLRDFSGDTKDIYLLYADSINKFTGGQLQAFKYPTLTDPVTNATRIGVASNIYVLEPSKKRLVILSKLGVLQNQIYFPNTSNLFDFSVDEAGRNIFLLDDNKLLQITF